MHRFIFHTFLIQSFWSHFFILIALSLSSWYSLNQNFTFAIQLRGHHLQSRRRIYASEWTSFLDLWFLSLQRYSALFALPNSHRNSFVATFSFHISRSLEGNKNGRTCDKPASARFYRVGRDLLIPIVFS